MHLKDTIKKLLPTKVFGFVRDLLYPEKIHIIEQRLSSLFHTYYKDVASPFVSQKTAFKNAEFKVYSKHGGDGILLYIFSKIGVANYMAVEMGIENGTECNTANLAINFGWKALLIDANKEWVGQAKNFFALQLGNIASNVEVVECFVTAESINPLFAKTQLKGEIDLLSIDVDSNDYWIWKAITEINPRVVVIEYNATYGSSRSATITYDPNFHFQENSKKYPLYFGASLSALVKLGKEKGYILVACDTHGHDAYFVRSDVAHGKFIELSAAEAFYANPYTLGAIGDIETQYAQIKHLEFTQI